MIFLMLYADFFSKHSFRNTIRVSNSLDLDLDQQNIIPDLDQKVVEM